MQEHKKIMEPETKTTPWNVQSRVPEAAYNCKYLTYYNNGELCPSCRIDINHRPCKGRCSKYKEGLPWRFITIVAVVVIVIKLLS